MSVFWYVLMSGSFLCGISASTILTVGISYIDDSLPVTSSPLYTGELAISNSYTMGCPPVRGDNPRALASGLSYVHVDNHGITILYHLHQCRPCTSRDILC